MQNYSTTLDHDSYPAKDQLMLLSNKVRMQAQKIESLEERNLAQDLKI